MVIPSGVPGSLIATDARDTEVEGCPFMSVKSFLLWKESHTIVTTPCDNDVRRCSLVSVEQWLHKQAPDLLITIIASENVEDYLVFLSAKELLRI
jgi:hypothetical protein